MEETSQVQDISEQGVDNTLDLKEVLSGSDPAAIIDVLKSGRLTDQPDMKRIREEWEPSQHKTIIDKVFLPDRVFKTTDAKGEPMDKTVKVNRIALPLQKKIVNTAVSFTFGNPVELRADVKNETPEEAVLNALNKLSHDCKLKSFNRSAFRDLLRCTEVAEYWHVVALPDGELYQGLGFDSQFKVRVTSFSPWNGDILYPYFDHTGDMAAFSREYKRIDNDKNETTYFEVYTADRHILWEQTDASWKVLKDVRLPFKKIPIVYVSQESVEWVDVQYCIERLEYLLSKFAETNDYHASPTVFVQGKILSMPERGESGKVLQGDKDSDAHYLSWDHAPESVKLEIENLIRFIYGQTQTPDISFDSVKGLHQISGEALKMLFMDAHLKVEEKREVLDSFLQRRVNVQKAVVASINKDSAFKKAAANLQIEPEIIPWIIDDETTKISNLVTANGGKPLISKRTGIKMLGWAKDVDEELKLIQEEEKEAGMQDVFQPAE